MLMFLMSAVFLVSKVVDVPDVCSAPAWSLQVFLMSKVVDVPGVCNCSWCLNLLMFLMFVMLLVSASVPGV